MMHHSAKDNYVHLTTTPSPADYVIGCADHHQHAGDVLLQHGRYLFCG